MYTLTTDQPINVSDTGNIRKRVCKACDRCRLKKSKCDGLCPCARCKTDNAICVFGERKKSQDKVYPKGYVEMLEQQQTQIVHAVKELYRKCAAAGQWPGDPLPLEPGGYPLTHHILERLNCITINESTGAVQPFEEDFIKIQDTLVENGAPMDDGRASSTPDVDASMGNISPISNDFSMETKMFQMAPLTPPHHHADAPSHMAHSIMTTQVVQPMKLAMPQHLFQPDHIQLPAPEISNDFNFPVDTGPFSLHGMAPLNFDPAYMQPFEMQTFMPEMPQPSQAHLPQQTLQPLQPLQPQQSQQSQQPQQPQQPQFGQDFQFQDFINNDDMH